MTFLLKNATLYKQKYIDNTGYILTNLWTQSPFALKLVGKSPKKINQSQNLRSVMKKYFLLFIVVVLFSTSINAQLKIQGRALGLGTHVYISMQYTGKIDKFIIESVSNFWLEQFYMNWKLYNNGWICSNPFFYNNFSSVKIAAVGNNTWMYEEEIAELRLFVPSTNGNLSTLFTKDENSYSLNSTNFLILNLPYSMYGNLTKTGSNNLTDAKKLFNLVGTIPANDTLAVICNLSGTPGELKTWDVQELLNKLADSNYLFQIFRGNENRTMGSVIPVTAEWKKIGNNKYGLFSQEKITNGDLIGKNLSSLQSNGAWFKKDVNNKKAFFINQNYSTNSPILVADQPVELSGTVNNGRKIIVSSVVTDVEKDNSVPTELSLEQNYPNPFNPTTTINYALPTAGIVTLKVYDILGQEVATLVNETKSAGKHEVKFDASRLSSGIYFYQLKTGNFTKNQKMILMK